MAKAGVGHQRRAATAADILGTQFGKLTGRFAEMQQIMEASESEQGREERRPRSSRRQSAGFGALAASAT